METFPTIVKHLYQLATVAKSSILDTNMHCMWPFALSFHRHVVFLLENLNDLFRDYLSAVSDFHEYTF